MSDEITNLGHVKRLTRIQGGIDTRGLARIGLTISKVSQISREVSFEVPVRLSSTRCLGIEEIGAFSYCGPGCEVKNVSIGRFCSIAPNVAIGPPEHPIDWVSSHPVQYNGLNWFSKAPHWAEFANPDLKWRGNSRRTIIGNDVWIGRNVVVRQGVTVGDGAIIGANSFVNRDVPPYAIIAGQPAKLIRYRFSDTIRDSLLDLKWWEWIPPKGECFLYDDPISFIEQFQQLLAGGRLKSFRPTVYYVKNIADKLEVAVHTSDQSE